MYARLEHTLYLLLKHRCVNFQNTSTSRHTFACPIQHIHSPKAFTDTSTCSPYACMAYLVFPALLMNFKSWVQLSPKTGSIRLLPPLALFPFGLSTSLLSMQQRYQAKNVFSVDSRHVGTGASTSMFEPAESEGVNTPALWNISLLPPVSGRRNRRNKTKPYKNRFGLCCLLCFSYSSKVISFDFEIIYTLYWFIN